ncbi:MAG: glucose-6-phosphate isomerase [Planctomycetota bacterium]
MAIKLDHTNCLAAAVGPEHGIAATDLAKAHDQAAAVMRSLAAKRDAGTLGFFNLPAATDAVERINAFVHERTGQYDNVVVLGIGGSALGPLVLHRALNHGEWNILSTAHRAGAPRFFLVDNTDPELLAGVLDVCDLSRTLFIVISKSGTTVETVAAFRLACSLCKDKLGDAWTKHFALVTDPAKGWLRDVATTCKLPAFEVPPNVGGRFSVLSAVGLLPAALVGLDIAAVLRGAANANALMTHEPDANWPYMVAALHWLADTRHKKTVSVMMPYVQSLREFSDWYAQLWAESLGKKLAADGTPKVTGQTVVRATGATDQHSQLQLFIEGPNDKITTFIETAAFRRDLPIPAPPLEDPAGGYLDGHTFARVINVELQGTRGALTECQRPNLTLHIDRVDAETVGELIMGYQIATAAAGELYGINAFDQPGVELGKKIAKAILAEG